MGVAMERDRRYFEAATCARIALRTFSDRAGDLNALYQRVEGKLSAEEVTKLRDLESGIDGHLNRLNAEAGRARRDGKAFMTPEGEKVIGTFDGIQKEVRSGGTGRPEVAPPAKTPVYSDAELDARFVRGRIDVAKEHVRSGRPEKAIEILEDVVRSYPSHPESEPAKLLLKLLRKS
jgi:hypothetical protein